VVGVAETSEIFTILLRYIYPVPREHITSLDQISALMDVAQKYDFQAAISALAEDLMAPALLQAQPLRVYAIASRYHLE
ncbi:hypothetical protein SISSUDRAFT_973693, partial [Sistotremastrum suecicum HHB10207 ss-3]